MGAPELCVTRLRVLTSFPLGVLRRSVDDVTRFGDHGIDCLTDQNSGPVIPQPPAEYFASPIAILAHYYLVCLSNVICYYSYNSLLLLLPITVTTIRHYRRRPSLSLLSLLSLLPSVAVAVAVTVVLDVVRSRRH